MKMIRRIAKIDTTNAMTIAFDVSKDKLNYYSEVQGKITGNNYSEQLIIQDEVENNTLSIIGCFTELQTYALSAGFSGIHIVCEPTGSYSDLLLRIAHDKGHTTAYVSGESVHKAKVIENNDNSKDDIKDPRIIFMLSKMGKELTYRTNPPKYKALRQLNRLYDTANDYRIAMKCEIHHVLIRLFKEFPMGKDFIYGTTGKALYESYGFNPQRIAQDSFAQFKKKLQSKCAGSIQAPTFTKLYEASKRAVLHLIPDEEAAIMEQHFSFLYDDYVRYDQRRTELRKQIETIYWELTETEKVIPIADEKVMTPFYLGRILGETGPLTDFNHWRMLFKYGGLNLRKRESGYYKGKLKMSKKGRSALRGILGCMAFMMVKYSGIFAEYHHRRKDEEKMPGTKLLAIVERKLLKIIWGMAKRKEAYNHARFMTCESQYSQVA